MIYVFALMRGASSRERRARVARITEKNRVEQRQELLERYGKQGLG